MIDWQKLLIYMAGVFIQLYSQVIDFSTFFPSLKWKFTTVSVIYGFKKATQSVS